MYYICVYNRPILSGWARTDVENRQGINLDEYQNFGGPKAQLTASGRRRRGRARPTAAGSRLGIDAAVWPVTSWNELRRDGLDAEAQLPAPDQARRTTSRLSSPGRETRIVASLRLRPRAADQIRQWV